MPSGAPTCGLPLYRLWGLEDVGVFFDVSHSLTHALTHSLTHSPTHPLSQLYTSTHTSRLLLPLSPLPPSLHCLPLYRLPLHTSLSTASLSTAPPLCSLRVLGSRPATTAQWCSLYQAPRTEAQQACFRRAFAQQDLYFAHQLVSKRVSE